MMEVIISDTNVASAIHDASNGNICSTANGREQKEMDYMWKSVVKQLRNKKQKRDKAR